MEKERKDAVLFAAVFLVGVLLGTGMTNLLSM